MRDLCKYYDKKACLNLKHTDTIIDVFRFCIRKDQVLSKSLERRTASRETGEPKSDKAHIELETSTHPQTSSMEVDTRSKLDMLSNKNVPITEFERTLDELQGDGQSLLEEFVDWQAAGTTYSFNDLRNELCGDAKFKFDDANVWLFGLVYSCTDSKKGWTSRTIDLENIVLSKTSQNIEGIV